MTESEFHKQRTIFLIRNDCLFSAPKGLDQTHAQWFESLGVPVDEAIENDVRGYYDGTGLYFYQGKDFHGGDAVKKIVERFLPVFDVPPKTNVYVGLIPQEVKPGEFVQFPGIYYTTL